MQIEEHQIISKNEKPKNNDMRNNIFGRRARQKGRGMGVCVCAKCGYSCSHGPGNPCRNQTCPVCGIPLVRDNKFSASSTADNNDKKNQNSKNKKMETPKVNSEICTGCAACVDACPMEAIILKDGKAFILEDKCANCRICESECPVEAIS